MCFKKNAAHLLNLDSQLSGFDASVWQIKDLGFQTIVEGLKYCILALECHFDQTVMQMF